MRKSTQASVHFNGNAAFVPRPPESIASKHIGDAPSPKKNYEQEELLIQRGLIRG